jgi:hypothetical protein
MQLVSVCMCQRDKLKKKALSAEKRFDTNIISSNLTGRLWVLDDYVNRVSHNEKGDAPRKIKASSELPMENNHRSST